MQVKLQVPQHNPSTMTTQLLQVISFDPTSSHPNIFFEWSRKRISVLHLLRYSFVRHDVFQQF